MQYKQTQKNTKRETLLTCLADLFYSIATQKKKVGTIAPKKFIQRLRKENGVYCDIIFYVIIFYLNVTFKEAQKGYMVYTPC